MSEENWEDDVGGGVASMSIGSVVVPPGGNNSGGCGRGQWFDSSKDRKPGGGEVTNSNNEQWTPNQSSNGFTSNQSDSFGQGGQYRGGGGGGYGQSENRYNRGDRNGYRGGRDGGGRRYGDEGGNNGFGGERRGGNRYGGDGGGGNNRDSNNESGGGRRYGGGGGGGGSYNRDSNNESGGGRHYGGGGSGYNRDSNDDSGGGRRYVGGGFNNRDANYESNTNSWDSEDTNDRGGGRRGGFRGGRGGGSYGNDRNNDGSSSGFGGSGGYNRGDTDEDGGRNCGGRGGFSGGRGGGGFNQNNGGQEEGGEPARQPVPRYIPPSMPEDEASLFTTIKSGINFSKYNEIEVSVTGDNVPPKIHSFEDSGLRQILIENVKKAAYSTPTPVQKYAIPIIASGRDLMACAQTGSGKTAAFLLPMFHNILDNPESVAYKEVQEPYALIVAPTRELALQIYNEAYKFAYGSVVKCVVAYGGVSLGYCLQQIQSGCHVLVGTPGRLIDVINRGKVTFNKLRYFVLDEADRLLDKNFRVDVDKMIQHPTMPPKGSRQTLMFSATFDEEVQQFAATILSNYLFLAVGKIGGANVDVEQNFIRVENHEKKNTLINILDMSEKVLVFIEKKRNADFVASILSQKGYPTTSIHGDRFQAQREEALRDFRTGKMMALVATSLASRGLDINEVAHVVNYDLPHDIDDYVHRIGRTGRVGNPGKATSFYDPRADQSLARPLVKMLKDACKPVPDWLQDEAANASYSSGSYRGGSFGSRDIRNPMDFANSRSGHDHWDGGATSSSVVQAPVVEEEESWD